MCVALQNIICHLLFFLEKSAGMEYTPLYLDAQATTQMVNAFYNYIIIDIKGKENCVRLIYFQLIYLWSIYL